jgi:glyoxylase-like metal-dependent hydrolase (beta-lactamase superfamily II)
MTSKLTIQPFPDIANIHPIAIPLPADTQLVTANLYAVGNGPITLIDTGPKFPGLLDFVEERLKAAGFKFEDIERIIATHGHVDHIGLANQIRKAAGHSVKILMHSEDFYLISTQNYREDMWNKRADMLLNFAGMPDDEVKKAKQRFRFFKSLYDPVDDIVFLEDGLEFAGSGYHLTVVHTPGHTAGSVCLYEQKEKILFSGDTIIKHITPNPLVEMNKARRQNNKYQSLPAFLDSLEKLSKMDIRYVFSGHGEYIDDIHSIIATYKHHHRQRMDLIWQALKKGSRPLYEMISDVFPIVPEGDTFLAISEIAVHLEMLVNEGRAALIDEGPPALYRAL